MTTADIPPLDRSALVYRHHERLYRLALLVAGDAGAAAALVQQAYRQVPEMAPDPEALLTHALLAGRPGRQRWRLATSDADLARATLGRPQAAALLDALARLRPAARLIIGLYYVSGREPGEIAALLGSAVGDQPPAEVLAHFRAEAARAVELVPAGADTQTLLRLDRWAEGGLAEEEATALRRDIFEQPDLRALRDGVIAARDLLPRAIPALFAAMPPLDLTDRLLKIVQGRRRAGPPRVSTRWAQGLLALGVLVLAAAIILVPSLVSRGAPPATLRTPPVADLIDGAIHRFDRAPLQQGVL
ncbi:MAG TPA: hypothetical protein VF897_19600, partial [Roseiflexaceae bacterium]